MSRQDKIESLVGKIEGMSASEIAELLVLATLLSSLQQRDNV